MNYEKGLMINQEWTYINDQWTRTMKNENGSMIIEEWTMKNEQGVMINE